MARRSSVAWQVYSRSPFPSGAGPSACANSVSLVATAEEAGSGCSPGLVHPLQPGVLPVEQAARLTTPVGGPVAAQVFEVDCVLHLPELPPFDGVAGLVRARAHPEALPAVVEHLGHEGQRVELSIGVERGEDLLLTPNLDDVADTQGRGADRAPVCRAWCRRQSQSDCVSWAKRTYATAMNPRLSVRSLRLRPTRLATPPVRSARAPAPMKAP